MLQSSLINLFPLDPDADRIQGILEQRIYM